VKEVSGSSINHLVGFDSSELDIPRPAEYFSRIVKAKAGFISAPFLLTILLTGCATTAHRSEESARLHYKEAEDQFYWGRNSLICLNAGFTGDTPEYWCAEANNKGRTREHRCLAATILFAYYARLGMNTDDMRKVIPDPRWLDECRLVGPYMGGTGYLPLFLQKDACPYRLVLFPDKTGSIDSDWSVWFNLTCSTYHARSTNEALAFLKGAHPEASVTLLEFALSYPFPGSRFNSIEERHSPRGVGIKIWPGEWFE
jgi:hypothetical protein